MSGYTYRANIGTAQPMRPADFHRLTPAQRRELAARRQLQVESAREARPVIMPTQDRIDYTIYRMVKIVDDLLAEVTVPLGMKCAEEGCQSFARKTGRCGKHSEQVAA